MSVKEDIQKNILFYRKKAKLSQKDLADLLGVNHTAISNWENGHNSIDIETLKSFSDIVNVSLSTIFGESEKSSPSSEAQEIATLFDKADDHDKETVRHVLGRYSGVEIAKELHPNTREKVI